MNYSKQEIKGNFKYFECLMLVNEGITDISVTLNPVFRLLSCN